MKYELLTCIVLTYKNGDYLYETVDSILNQDYMLIASSMQPPFSHFFINPTETASYQFLLNNGDPALCHCEAGVSRFPKKHCFSRNKAEALL